MPSATRKNTRAAAALLLLLHAAAAAALSSPPPPRRVAVVGAGVGGAFSAAFLRNLTAGGAHDSVIIDV
jgi:threonine dehydrogenase-like Zn-dependent dehydrogenase